MTNKIEHSDIVEIDGERYLVPYVRKDGELVMCIDSKIKLPIEITSGFHIHKRTDYEPPKSILSRLLDGFSNLRKRR